MKKYLILCLLVASVASAFNLSPFTYEIRQRGAATNNLIVRNDSIIGTNCAVSLQNIVKALDKIVADTIQGSGTIVGIGSDTIRFDYDSSGTVAIMTFGGYGGGIRWNRGTDKMQFSNDFSTWTDIGTGGTSSTDADSLGHIIFKPRVKTDGYIVKYDADGDSLYLSEDATGASADSNAQVYSSDRYQSYTGSGLFYIGNNGDSTFIVVDSLGNYAIVWANWYVGVEDPDSITMLTKHWIESMVGDSVSGLITGINSANGITGGASQGVATLQLDGSAFYVGGDTVRIFNNNTGRLIFNVFGTPTDINEFVIAENSVIFGTGVTVSGLTNSNLTIADGFREVQTADSAYPTVARVNSLIAASPSGDITSVALGNGGTGDGTSGAVTLNVVSGTSTGLAANADSVYLVWTWLYSFIDTTSAKIPTATIADTSRDVTKHNGDQLSIVNTTTGGLGIQSVNGAINVSADGAGNNGRVLFSTGGGVSSVIIDSSGLKLGAGDKLTIGGDLYYNLDGDALAAVFGTDYQLNVVAGTSTGLAVNADSVYITTVPDAKIATTLTRDSEAGGFIHDSLFANTPGYATKVNVHDSIWANTPGFLTTETGDISSVVAGDGTTGGATSGAATINVVGGWSIRVFPDSIAVANVPGDSITTGTVADARIATTITRDTEASGLAHDTLWANTPGFGTKTNIHDSIWANTPGFITANQSITLSGDVSGTGTTAITTTIGSDKIATAMVQTSAIDSTKIAPASILLSEMATNAVDSTKIVNSSVGNEDLNTGSVNSAKILDASVALGDMASGSVDSTKIVDGGIGSGDIGTGRITTTHVLNQSLLPADLDTNGDYTTRDLRVNGKLAVDTINGGQGLQIGSNIVLGTDITDDTAIVTLSAEWAGAVLSRGYGDDSTKYWDSLNIRGGSDSYGNYIEFAKLTDTTSSALRRRHWQITIPVPMDADSVYDVALSFRVFDGTGGESTYVRLKWSTTPFDSTNAFKLAYIERDSSNSTTFDTLSASYARTSATRGSKIYALVTGLLYDKHVTWIRCYDVIMTYHRRYL